jgi:hypothetical protein
MKKVCRTCSEEKNITEFSIWSGRKSYRPDCKMCIAKKQREYLKTNEDVYERTVQRQREKWRNDRQKELELLTPKLGKIKKCTKCGYEGPIKNFERDASTKNAISKIRLRGTCKPCAIEKEKEWRENNPDKIKQYNKKTYARRKNDAEFMSYKKNHSKEYNSREEVKDRRNEAGRKMKNSPIGLWRRLLSNALTQLKTVRPKQTRTFKLLGYSHTELFNVVGDRPNGDYHLDHSIPLSWMVSNTPPSIACGLNNLTWLTETDNLAKNNRYANPVTLDYFKLVKDYIKEEYLNRFVIDGDLVIDSHKEVILERWSKGLSSVL